MKNFTLFFFFVQCFTQILFSQSEGDWQSLKVYTGYNPPCQNVSPKYDYSLDNYLRISITGNYDIVVKLINYDTDKCIRYIYIIGGDTYEIRNIPQGTYYVKYGFGSDFSMKKSGYSCEAKFLDNSKYEKSDKLMNFNIVESYDGYQVPSFELQLKVKKGNSTSHKISENEFLD
jgi:hypothetical protein